ncbi:uncharacterized protein LOC142532774 isoform X2 [Primulina tabacum]|uniref:uncharacterized protein LOC142532774 isoform X2 n=1 Tax=Primulina tabacum TaxID=48773 RepID=UPI003F596982
MVDMSSKSTSLKDYLKKYTSNDDAEKKKKKKIKKGKPVSEGVLIVDEDPTWQRPVKLNEEEDSTDEDKPQVDEDIEVKHMKRLEQLRSKRPFGAISEDGSGWVSVSQNSKNLEIENQNSDIYPPPKRRPRNDTPSPKPNREPVSVSDVDLSPPRQPRKHLHSASSPPRRAPRGSGYRDDSHASSATDLSPPRKVDNGKTDFMHISTSKSIFKTGDDAVNLASSVSDLSPPRKRRKESPLLIDRAKTGLVSGVDIKEEIDRKKKEDLLRFKEMDPSVSGRNAEAVYRNKSTGERMSKEEFLKSQKDKMKKEEKPKFRGISYSWIIKNSAPVLLLNSFLLNSFIPLPVF